MRGDQQSNAASCRYNSSWHRYMLLKRPLLRRAGAVGEEAKRCNYHLHSCCKREVHRDRQRFWAWALLLCASGPMQSTGVVATRLTLSKTLKAGSREDSMWAWASNPISLTKESWAKVIRRQFAKICPRMVTKLVDDDVVPSRTTGV